MSFSTASKWLKVAAMLLGVVFIVHVIGFATTSWATMEMNTGGTMVLYLGLWQLCGCYSHYCSCFEQANDRVWFKAVQITEAVGLAGILICGVVTVALLCSKPKGALRIFNFVVLLISSMCIVVGVIIFGCETRKVIELEEEMDNVDIDLRSSLGFSFYISAIAGGIGLLVCIPLFVADSRSKQLERPETAPQCPNQGQMVIASTGIVNFNGQHQADYFQNNMPPGNMQPYPVFYSQGHVGLSVQGYMAPPYARDPPPYTEKPTAVI